MTRLAALLLILLMPAVAGAQLMAFRGFDPAPPIEYQVPVIAATLASLETGATVITPVDSSELTSLLTGGTVDGTTLATAAGAGPVVIKLDSATTYTGEFTFPNLDQSDWIYVVTSAFNSLPASGTRTTASDRSNMPLFNAATNSGVSGYWYCTLNVAQGAEKYRFVGLEAAYPAGAYFGAGLFNCGNETEELLTTDYAISDAELPHDIIIDRCEFYGRDADGTMGDDRKAILFDVYGGAVVDSRITDIADLTSDDPMAILAFMGGQQVLIENNEISASGECLILGGIDGYVDYLQDWVIRGNYFYKPLYWNANDATYDTHDRSIKNHLELKKAKRVLIEGNVIENCWTDAQFGEAFVFTVRNQDGTDPGAIITDVNCRNNYVVNCESGFRISGEDDINSSALSARISITNNLIETGSTNFIRLTTTNVGPISWLRIKHNTFLAVDGDIAANSSAVAFSDSPTLWVDNFVFTDNIATYLYYGVPTAAEYATKTNGETVSDNGFILDDTSDRHASDLSGFATVCPNDIKADDVTDVLFTNLAGGIYSLQATSPFYQQASDGTDIGVNWTELQAAISGVAP